MYKNPLSHGFGEDIDWVSWDNAIELAEQQEKPIFLLVHKTWCHACKSLKKTLESSNARKAFKILSKYFIMVNTEDDEEPYEDEYRPDGKYIPRLVFLDKNGDLLEQFINKRGEQKNYKYYYSTPADIVASMKSVLKYYGVKVPELEKAKSIKPKKVSKKVDEKDDKKVEENKKEEKKADDKKDENKKEDKSSSKNDKKTEL
ncbi:Thioredoxin-like fold domain-containing protein [Strongyloides ratti]|uniref:Thioredoxin-like fold domain-containing protein n=1 Tax=Strongyloides ratti TaxID=34506 RepID=A0A090KV91_STRRB|nr:Thioredoxin-like fold domain-containing protein [Strongyloides ratti]CEF59760.1 Thioredoxin-like fold domain-containing protein [Strongyloides ratti]